MGTWGSGIFESDAANAYVEKLLAKLLAEINENLSPQKLNQESFLENTGEYHVIPAIDIFVTLSTEYDISPAIELEQSKKWRRQYLQAFDKDDSMYFGNFKAERRSVIESTFDKLDSLIEEWNE